MTQEPMEVSAGLIKLKPGSTADVRDWSETLARQKAEVLDTLRHEGVALECWFEIEVAGEPYLMWFMHARSIEKARDIFLNSDRPIDIFHKETMMRIAESHIEAGPIAELSVDL